MLPKHLVHVIDGTQDSVRLQLPTWQRMAIDTALLAFTPLVHIECAPDPKTLNMPDYLAVQDTLARVKRQDGRIDYDDFAQNIYAHPDCAPSQGLTTLVLLDESLSYRGQDIRGGRCEQPWSEQLVVLSTSDVEGSSLGIRGAGLAALAMHELGHAFGATPSGRIRTVRNGGSHCIDSTCIMQAELDPMEMASIATANASPFCYLCRYSISTRK